MVEWTDKEVQLRNMIFAVVDIKSITIGGLSALIKEDSMRRMAWRLIDNGLLVRWGGHRVKKSSNFDLRMKEFGWEEPTTVNLRDMISEFQTIRDYHKDIVHDLDTIINRVTNQKTYTSAEEEIASWPKWKQDACREATDKDQSHEE